jgi:hypothetical protein
LSTDALHRLQCERTTDSVDLESVVLLKLTQALRGEWTEDAVCLSTIETKSSQSNLQLFDVVTTKMWRREVQQPCTECPGGFDQRLPCGVITMIENGKSALALELLQRVERSFTERAQPYPNEAERVSGGETNLEIADERLVAQRLAG